MPHVIEELGDMLFYTVSLMNFLQIPLNQVLAANMAKLAKRYPTGYTDQAAQARADKEQG